jgi:signal transduction histidine kinase/ActR/RegA family two-component response regulator
MWLGWKPAIIVLVGGFANALFWLEPHLAPIGESIGNQVSLAAYLVAGGILLALGAKLNQLRFRAADAEQVLSSQVQDLQALQDLGSRVMLLPDLDSQLAAILRALCSMQATDKGLVAVIGPETGSLRVAASLGFADGGRAAAESLSLAGDALERREDFLAVHNRPLLNMAGEVFGVLSLHFADPRRPSPRDNQLADLCCQLASVLAERETLRQDALALSRQVEVALESSAVPFCLFQPLHNADGAVVDFRWQYLNGAAARTMGRELGEVVGHTVQELLPRTWNEPGLVARFLVALERNATVEFEFRGEGRAGRWFHVIASPCEDGLAAWFSDVSERKHQEQELREADRRKDEFLATLAHELRNPLAPIRQAAMIARLPSAKPEQQRWGLDVIDRQVSHMAVLLDDLLDVSRITRGKLELRKAVTDLREVVDAALEATRPAIDARRQQLTVQWPDAQLWSQVDAMRMAQVVSNLLTNASKYTPAGGRIWLSGRQENGEAVIDVRDDGIGIPREQLERVFEMFTQVRNGGSGAAVGLGIGLALSRGLAEMHGATLAAQSEGLGHGSTFTLRIGLCEPPALSPESPGAPQHEGGRSRRVLVADDNRDAAESLAEVLRMKGHEVALAFDGESALAQFRELAPEVALLDIGMPRMTGNEVASAIRSTPGGERPLLVAITGWGQQRDRDAARSAGFDFHFTKPVNPEQLLRLIEDPEASRAALALEE